MAKSPDDEIVMKHPKLGSSRVVVTRRALEESWAEQGWVEDTKADTTTAPATNPDGTVS